MSAPAVTPAAVQTALGDLIGDPKILIATQTDTATLGAYYVHGNQTVAGRVRWCRVTNTDTAADQATAILAVLRA